MCLKHVLHSSESPDCDVEEDVLTEKREQEMSLVPDFSPYEQMNTLSSYMDMGESIIQTTTWRNNYRRRLSRS